MDEGDDIIDIDPRELDALQRAQEQLEAIADDTPTVDEGQETPDAAGQPDFTQDVAAPEIDAPVIEDDAAQEPLLDNIPDISATPPVRKPSAWQIRHGQARPQPQQPVQMPAAEEAPRQQPAQPVAAPDMDPPEAGDEDQDDVQAPDLDEMRRAADQLGAFDERHKVFDWNRAANNDDGVDAGNNGQENPAEAGVKDAVKVLGDRFATLLNLIVDNLNELHGRTARNEQDLRSLLAEQIKRRA